MFLNILFTISALLMFDTAVIEKQNVEIVLLNFFNKEFSSKKKISIELINLMTQADKNLEKRVYTLNQGPRLTSIHAQNKNAVFCVFRVFRHIILIFTV